VQNLPKLKPKFMKKGIISMKLDTKAHACLYSNWTEIYMLAFLSPAISTAPGEIQMPSPQVWTFTTPPK
jgi:hypothetical protein